MSRFTSVFSQLLQIFSRVDFQRAVGLRGLRLVRRTHVSPDPLRSPVPAAVISASTGATTLSPSQLHFDACLAADRIAS